MIESEITLYCLKCKKSHTLKECDITRKTAKNGAVMAQGLCPTCGTKCTKFVKRS